MLLPKWSRLSWWILDGRYLLVDIVIGELSDYQVGLWTINCETGALNQTELSMTGLDIAGVSAQGNKLYFHTGGVARNEVWAMENFLPPVAAR